MSMTIDEAAKALKEIAGPQPVGHKVGVVISSVANRLRWKKSRVKDIWNRGPKVRLRPEEIDALSARLSLQQRGSEALQQKDANALTPEVLARLKAAHDALEALFAHIGAQPSRAGVDRSVSPLRGDD